MFVNPISGFFLSDFNKLHAKVKPRERLAHFPKMEKTSSYKGEKSDKIKTSRARTSFFEDDHGLFFEASFFEHRNSVLTTSGIPHEAAQELA